MNIVFIGAPGSGKGTQSREFIDKYNFVQLSTGDLLRASIKEGTDLGLKAKSFMDEGKLVPDEVMIGLVKSFLVDNSGKSVIFDGFPRTLQQAKELDLMLFSQNVKLDKIFYFKINPQILIKRLTGRRVCSGCGEIYHIITKLPKSSEKCDLCSNSLLHRSDDKEEVIVERLQQFDRNTGAVIEYYRSLNQLEEVDSAEEPSVVFKQIRNFLSF